MSLRITTRVAAYAAAGLLGAVVLTAIGASRPPGPTSGELTYAAGSTKSGAVTAAEDPKKPAKDDATKAERKAKRKARQAGAVRRFGIPGRVQHGEFVIRNKDGFKTVFVHRGEVTAVSATSITVKSADGVARTYAVTGETKVHSKGKPGAIADVKVGEFAALGGTRDGDAYTLRAIGHRPARPAKTPPATN